jgi:hypothetical protein
MCFATLVGVFIYQYLSKSESKKNENRVVLNSVVNTSTPNLPISDSFTTKQEVYTAQKDENNLVKLKKDEFNKGSDKFSKVNTNVIGEGDTKTFQKRVRTEVVQPKQKSSDPLDEDDPDDGFVTIKFPPKKEDPKKDNSENPITIKKGFNSFTMKTGSQKESNNTTSIEKINTSPSNFNQPSNVSSDINCLAIVTSKSKIASRGSIIITISDNLSIPGDIILPAGTNIAARASVMEDRVMLEIESANINGKIVRMNLKAYDLDGMEGLYVKNAKLQKSASSSANSTISNVSSVGENLLGVPGQLAGGIIRGLTGSGSSGSVTLPEGYKMILKNKF